MLMTTNRSPRLCAAIISGACCMLALPAWAEELSIADLAPANSFAVIGVDDSKTMFEAFDKTGFKALWDEPEFQKWLTAQSKAAMDEFAGKLDTIGLKFEDFKRPTGPMGAAMWFVSPENPQDEMPPPGMLFLCTYGDEAAAMDEKIVGALEKGKGKGTLELKEREHDGVTMYTFKPVQKKDEDAGGEDEDNMGMDEMPPPRDLWMTYARVEGALVACNHEAGTERAIDRLKGDKLPAVGDDKEFQAAKRQLGANHGYAIVLAEPIRVLAREAEKQAEEGSPEKSTSAIMTALGLDDLHAGSMGLRFDTDDAMLEQVYALRAPTKAGLLKLFEAPSMAFDPPAFVGADVQSVSMMQFNFNGVIPLVNQVIVALPEEMQAMAGQQVQAATMFVGPVLANVGPEVASITKMSRPFAADSQKQVWALKMRDAAALQQTIAGLMPMVGFESRDFQGNQVWSPAAGGMMPGDAVAIGMGNGWLFIGPTPGIEDTMRQGGAADNPKLATEARFKAATRPLGNQGIGYSYMEVAPLLEWFEWYSKNIEKITADQSEQMFGGEPPADDEERQWREDAKKSAIESIPAWMKSPPPMALVRKHVGDFVGEFKATAEGFEGRSLLLRPGK